MGGFDFCLINTQFWDDQLHRVWPLIIEKAWQANLGGNPVIIVVSYFHLSNHHCEQWSAIFERSSSHFPGATPIIIREGAFILAFNHANLPGIHVMEAPPVEGPVSFGEVMYYFELHYVPGSSVDILCLPLGVLWTPYVSGTSAARAAVAYLHSRLALEMSGIYQPGTPTLHVDVEAAIQAYHSRVSGCVMITDTRDVPSEGWMTSYWHACGKVRVAGGSVGDKGFIPDGRIGNQPLIACPPAYFRLKTRRTAYQFPSHRDLYAALGDLDPRGSSGQTRTVILPTSEMSQIPEQIPEQIPDQIDGTEEMPQIPEKIDGTEEMPQIPEQIDGTDVCMVCISAQPVFVMEKCRHLGLCSKCRTLVYRSQLNENRGRTVPHDQIMWRTMFETMCIKCPYCRKVTKTVHKDNFKEPTFHC